MAMQDGGYGADSGSLSLYGLTRHADRFILVPKPALRRKATAGQEVPALQDTDRIVPKTLINILFEKSKEINYTFTRSINKSMIL
jgi:hypothetical protein